MDRNFMEMVKVKWSQGKFVCVGLDTDYQKIPGCIKGSDPKNSITAFNRAIVDGTKDLVCAYKLNIAFYLAYGTAGLKALKKTMAHINRFAPDIPTILDAKLADIGNTNNGYVQEIFGYLNADAVTVHPYLGAEALQSFLGQKDKGIIVLCRTSNPGGGEFQDLYISSGGMASTQRDMQLYKYIASSVVNEWNQNNNCMVVVGATYPEELREVREIVRDMPILIPGIGSQGGDLEKSVQFGKDSYRTGFMINSSRGIIFASDGPDFAQAARRETVKLNNSINEFLYKNN